MNRNFGGQDKRDGAKRRPSVCLHILFDGAMPWRDGAISAPSLCAATILEAPDCQTRGQEATRVATTTIRPEGIDHGA